MGKELFLLLFPLLLMATIAVADSCLNNQTSQSLVTVNGNVTNTTSDCSPFLCSNVTGRCNSSPTDPDNFILYLMLPLVSFVMFYFSSILKEEDWMIHLLLYGTAMLFIIAPLGVVSEAFPYFTGLYYLMIVVEFIVIFYYILKIFMTSHRMMTAK